MKLLLLTVTLLTAFVSACTVDTATPANNGVSNSNAPTSSNAAAVKTEKTPAAGAENATSTNNNKSLESGQNSERVQFAAGKTETTLTRTIPANNSIDFVLNAQSRQRMQYSVIYDDGSDTDIEVFLSEPGSQDISKTSDANQNNEFIIKKTGDHRITVQNKTGNKVTVQFGVVIN
ncbi:MAG TPA: hypothetical protein VD968_02095 [Pyrinomonadaceae bacterium]|nr:hypothetical protein [Pyrinomonadaceae bacterium]